jgi:hypothetical protein
MTLKGGCYRVTWTVAKVGEDPIKMSELIRDVETGDQALATVRARYTQGETLKILSVAQLR